jgi:diamine N-acetyltransferase
MMISERVVVSGIEPEDVAQIVAWRNQPEIYSRFIEYEPLTTEGQRRFLDSLAGAANRRLWLVNARDPGRAAPYEKAVRPTDDAIPVGAIGIKDIDMRNRHCELAPLFIGDLRYRDFQVAFDAERLVLDHCFNHLGMERVIAYVVSSNPEVVKFQRALGFQEEGVLRRHVFKNGDFEDLVLLGLLRADYLRRFGRAASSPD